MVKILAIDDEMDLLVLIKNILTQKLYHVDIFQNPTEVPVSKLSEYDLILLDIMMPKIDGISYCKSIRDRVDCPILFLTAKSLESDIVSGFSTGADDYILKPFGVNELIARVDAHLRRDNRERHLSLNLGEIRFDLSANIIYVNDKKIPFTKSEYRICELLARRRGQVFSREQIYEMIFGYDGIGNSSAISEHIKNIRAKLQKEGVSPVVTVWGIGYKWESN